MISVFRSLKHSLLSNRCFQCPECFADNFFPQCKLLGLFQSRIPQRIGDGYCRNNPIGPDRQRDRCNRTDMDLLPSLHRNAYRSLRSRSG